MRRLLALGAIAAVCGLALATLTHRELATAGIGLIGLGAILTSIGATQLTETQRRFHVHDVTVRQGDHHVAFSEAPSAAGGGLTPQSATVIRRGEPFRVDLDLSAIEEMTVHSATCRARLEHRAEGTYTELFSTELRGGLDLRRCGAGTRVLCMFEGLLPAEHPTTSDDHRWTILVDVDATGAGDFAAQREIPVG